MEVYAYVQFTRTHLQHFSDFFAQKYEFFFLIYSLTHTNMPEKLFSCYRKFFNAAQLFPFLTHFYGKKTKKNFVGGAQKNGCRQKKSLYSYLLSSFLYTCMYNIHKIVCCKKLTFLIFMPFFTLLFPFRQMLNIIFGFQASCSFNGVGMEVISLKLFILGRICHGRMMPHSTSYSQILLIR